MVAIGPRQARPPVEEQEMLNEIFPLKKLDFITKRVANLSGLAHGLQFSGYNLFPIGMQLITKATFIFQTANIASKYIPSAKVANTITSVTFVSVLILSIVDGFKHYHQVPLDEQKKSLLSLNIVLFAHCVTPFAILAQAMLSHQEDRIATTCKKAVSLSKEYAYGFAMGALGEPGFAGLGFVLINRSFDIKCFFKDRSFS